MGGEGGGRQGRVQKGRSGLFSVVPSDRTRGHEHKLKHRRYCLNISKHIFTVRVTEHWCRLRSEAVESLSLEILKSCLDTVLGSLLCVTLFEQVVGQDNLQVSSNLNHSVICRSYCVS